MEFIPMTIKKEKNIALIAHQKKHELMEWCKANNLFWRNISCAEPELQQG